jgi:hypothetical protein
VYPVNVFDGEANTKTVPTPGLYPGGKKPKASPPDTGAFTAMTAAGPREDDDRISLPRESVLAVNCGHCASIAASMAASDAHGPVIELSVLSESTARVSVFTPPHTEEVFTLVPPLMIGAPRVPSIPYVPDPEMFVVPVTIAGGFIDPCRPKTPVVMFASPVYTEAVAVVGLTA